MYPILRFWDWEFRYELQIEAVFKVMSIFFKTSGDFGNCESQFFCMRLGGPQNWFEGLKTHPKSSSYFFFFHNQKTKNFTKIYGFKKVGPYRKLEIKWLLYHNRSCRKSSNNLIFSDIFHSPFWLLLSPTSPLFNVIASGSAIFEFVGLVTSNSNPNC